MNGSQSNLVLLKAIAESSFDSILITDASSKIKIIYANNAFKKLTGYSPSSVLGKSPRILQGPATDAKVITKLTQSMKSGKKFDGKTINYKKDGTPFIMHWRVLPIKSGKEIKAWLAVQREGSSL